MMLLKTRYMLYLLLVAVLLSGCYNKPVRHLASDVALRKAGESSRDDVLTFLGEPDEQIILEPGLEKWVYTEYEKSMFKEAPLVGRYFGDPNYGTVTIILEDNVVRQCVYGSWESDDYAWADDFDWQEKKQ